MYSVLEMNFLTFNELTANKNAFSHRLGYGHRVISCELNFDLACTARTVVKGLVHIEITVDTEQLTAVGTCVTLERGRDGNKLMLVHKVT